MTQPTCITRVRLEPIAPEFAQQAAAWAERLCLPLTGEAEYALQLGPAGLQFVELGEDAAGPIRVDFVVGGGAHRRKYGGGNGQMIAKAIGRQPGVRPTVLDATAGLGRDAFVLASVGCHVRMLERNPVVAALLDDGLARGYADAEIGGIVPDVVEAVLALRGLSGLGVQLF